METVQVRSKSFVIRWVDCEPGCTVSWKVFPEKKSINLGVYQFENGPRVDTEVGGVGGDVNISERMKQSGGRLLVELARRKGGETVRGECQPTSCVLAFVFDNTFSKNTAKSVGFSFDVDEPNLAGSLNNLKFQDASGTNLTAPVVSSDNRYLSGVLLKRRRKKLQGFARRYFRLDTQRGLLNYYLDNRSSQLRGVMPVKICEINFDVPGAIEIDSGVEKWVLKTVTTSDWETWRNALNATRSLQYGRMLSREPSVQFADLEVPEWKEVSVALAGAVAATQRFVAGGHAASGPAKTLVDSLHQSFATIQGITAKFTGTPALAAIEDAEENAEEDDDIFYDAEDAEFESDLSSVDSDSEEVEERLTPQKSVEAEGLYPLPAGAVPRRAQVHRCEHQPPSLLSLLRKGDLGNMSVPVTANEPISVLQRMAEAYEYSELLDQAAAAEGEDRLLLVAAFCVSNLSTMRVKERSMRKPFNPMLGECYELVREDKGFRFIAEKVSHRPPIFASEAQSTLWTVDFTSRPYQKVWGKSAEVGDTGTVRVCFEDEAVEYNVPDAFLRNLIAGEKYIEPVGTCVVSSPSGEATIEFKAGSMFSGRSEEVKITCGSKTWTGKWTEALSHNGKKMWAVGPLVEGPKDHYGWPQFTASLNETTALERDQLSPNDSRKRPDQLAYEDQDIDEAERLKHQLETHQRDRRKEYEQEGKAWEPIFFTQARTGTGMFALKTGPQNYWSRRKRQDWEGIVEVLK